MKKSLFMFAFAGLCLMVQAQEVPRFAKYPVGETGCMVYLPAAPEGFEVNDSEDGSQVYTAEVTQGGFNWSVIVVEFKEPLGETVDKESNADLLAGYMDFLQAQLGITGSAGYGRGHSLESHEDATGLIDYWEDAEGLQYAVKGWIDNYHLAVLVLYGKEEYPIYNAQDMFLNGFRFPEE